MYIMNEDDTSGKLTRRHNPEAKEDVWCTTKDVLGRSGIELEDCSLFIIVSYYHNSSSSSDHVKPSVP